MKRITVILAEDNAFVRKEYRNILEGEADLEVVGEAKNGREAVALVKKLRPALVLMDVAMPLMNGIQAIRQILEAFPATKVLMLSSHDDDVYVAEAMNSGAIGYLVKHTAANCVCQAIREVSQGGTFFSPSVSKHLRQPKVKKAGCGMRGPRVTPSGAGLGRRKARP
jgi:DNA-binding NarL/FixJ family response regulator